MIEKYAQGDPPRRGAPKTPRAETPAPTAAPAAETPAPTAAPAAPTPTTTPANVPRKGGPAAAPTGGGTHTLAFSPAIKKMQESIIALAKAVNSQIKLEDMGQTTSEIIGKDQYGKDVNAPAHEAGEAASRGHFSNFIAKMLRDSDPEGVEFDPSPTKTNMNQKQPSEATRMYTVMNTISRLGSASKEVEPDGKWGPRTNTGLRDTAAFASAMLRLAGAFNTPIKSYTDADLKAFVVPEKDTELTYAQKNEQAPILTKHVEAIHRMFEEIRKKILENPRHQSYIEGNQEYTSYKKVTQMDPAEKGMREAWSKQRFPGNDVFVNMAQPGGGGNLQAKINYSDLVSPESFQTWLDSDEAKQFKQKGVDKAMIVDAIRKTLQSVAGSA